MKKIALSSFIAGLALAAAPAWSAIEYYEVQTAPPAMQVEVTPAPQAGQVWIPGYYDYRGTEYTWVPGHFEAARQGYVYSAPRYVENEHRYYKGRWVTDEEEHGGTRNKLHAKKDKVREALGGKPDKD